MGTDLRLPDGIPQPMASPERMHHLVKGYPPIQESPLTRDKAIAISSKYLNNLGIKRLWPPAVRTEHLIAEKNPQGWPMDKTAWSY